MMRPKKVSFYVYAESDEEAKELENALYHLVLDIYGKGKLVTASKLKYAIAKFGNNPIITNFF